MRPAPRSLLITGASSGLGAALAQNYAAPGTQLALTGRDAGRLAAVAQSCRNAGAAVETAALDVTDREALAQWIAGIDSARPLDLVIANAGIAGGTENEEAARRIFAVNLDGVLNTVYPVLPRMAARRSGQIALMGSLAGFRGLPDTPAYCASKAAVKALAEAWRGSFRASGVQVSVICPGFVTTAMTAGRQSPMPFLMSAERAAAIIARGLARDRPRIAFPWPMHLAAWLLAALPPRLADRALRPQR